MGDHDRSGLPRPGELPEPAAASLDSILSRADAVQGAGPFEFYRWDRFPTIIVFIVTELATQDRMFSRLAFFLEKRGFRGRLLSNEALAGRRGWNAHDYGCEGLASFFDVAAERGFRLNPEELLVEQIALREALLRERQGRILPGEGGIISICRSSPAIERRILLAHESYHGLFFASEEYRDFCFGLWDSAPETMRRFWSALLDALGYDSADRYLAVNECQAYLMQQPLHHVEAYFARVEKLIGGNDRAPDAREVLPILTLSAARIDSFLESKFDLRAGGAYEIEAVP
jgi:hypothetical protein